MIAFKAGPHGQRTYLAPRKRCVGGLALGVDAVGFRLRRDAAHDHRLRVHLAAFFNFPRASRNLVREGAVRHDGHGACPSAGRAFVLFLGGAYDPPVGVREEQPPSVAVPALPVDGRAARPPLRRHAVERAVSCRRCRRSAMP